VVSATAIQFCHLAVRQHPHEARHLGSGGAFIHPDPGESLAYFIVDIESKNAGIRELHFFFTNHYGCQARE
jgi:hypothetical protein